MTKKYNTHWHLRITGPTEDFVEQLKLTLDTRLKDNILTYYALASGEEPTTRSHIHAAIGTTNSIKTSTLSNYLKLLPKNNNYVQYDLKGTYLESTPYRNYMYVKNHTMIKEAGNLEIPDIKTRLLADNFYNTI